MSRFYDVLKNASRAAPPPQEGVGSVESESFRSADVADILATFHESEVSEIAEPLTSPLAHSAEVSAPLLQPDRPLEEILQPAPPPIVPAPQNGSFGTLVHTNVKARARLLSDVVDSMSVERYRLLRTQIFQKQAEKMFRTLLVTSPGAQEGKTLTVINLALTFAMLPSFRVLVVDGDLRRGSLEQYLGIEGRLGFSDLIQGSATLEEVALRSHELPISFMARGNSRLPAPELLHSPQMSLQLQEMSKHFDLVLVDSPPTNLVTDAQLLASACDAVLLVARAFSTPQKSLEAARRKLLGCHVIGTVLNGRSGPFPGYGYGYSAYYQG